MRSDGKAGNLFGPGFSRQLSGIAGRLKMAGGPVRVAKLARLRMVLGAGLLVLLAACSARPSLPADVLQQGWHWPLPQTLLLRVEPAEGTGRDYLLVLQDDAGVLRVSLLDPAGMPVARKQLHNGRWRNEGLLPPQAGVEDWLNAIVRRLTGTLALPDADEIALELHGGDRLHFRQLE